MSHTVFLPADRPEVEVLVDGSWHYGELRMWSRGQDGAWLANVTWGREAGEHRIDTFAADNVSDTARSLAAVDRKRQENGQNDQRGKREGQAGEDADSESASWLRDYPDDP
jgi:hypothetical protein